MRSSSTDPTGKAGPTGSAGRGGGAAPRPARVSARRQETRSAEPPFPGPISPDIAFLVRPGLPAEALRHLARLAARRGTAPSEGLLARGLDPRVYWSRLADSLGLPFLESLSGAEVVARSGMLATDAVRRAASVTVREGDEVVLVLAPQPDELALLRRRLVEAPALARRIRIATPQTIRAFLVAHRHAALTHYAVNRLSHVLPRLSARRLRRRRGAEGPTALVAALLALLVLAPLTTVKALALASTLFFVNCAVWKTAAALWRARPLCVAPAQDDRLPSYTVLIPLYREAAVVADLAAHMKRIDYPGSRLQILLIVEADDLETRTEVARHAAAPPFEIVVVPPGGPRTKPKALTYALAFARGEYVVVFDAEDRPELDQLRKAVAAFRRHPELGCVQARLTPDNEGSWFARMFTLEYAANFDVLLPALAEWGAPLPLGGTSNHFPRALLERVAAWDPFNVTEDADLGIRLARYGYRTATIGSRTYEEAPVSLRQWLPQRRRWIKGWMQTCAHCLHREAPRALRLPLWQQLAVHGILTAGVLGLLLYPLSLAAIVWIVVAAWQGDWPSSADMWAVLALGLGNLAAVLTAAAVSAVRGLRATGALHLAWYIPFLPLYWALMSLAAWQALIQLFRAPSHWEKTAHGIARDRRQRTGPPET